MSNGLWGLSCFSQFDIFYQVIGHEFFFRHQDAKIIKLYAFFERINGIAALIGVVTAQFKNFFLLFAFYLRAGYQLVGVGYVFKIVVFHSMGVNTITLPKFLVKGKINRQLIILAKAKPHFCIYPLAEANGNEVFSLSTC